MYGILIKDLELLSNNKSFQIQIDTMRDLWILLHLRELHIVKSSICYQRETFYRKEPYPIRKMKKSFRNTPELISYLNMHSWRYNSRLRKFSIDFSNGWNVRISGFHIELEFNTNSLEERDILINQLLSISGIDPIDCSRLVPNINYMISLDDNHLKTFSDMPQPDQFWTEGQIRTWNRVEHENESIYPTPKYYWNY